MRSSMAPQPFGILAIVSNTFVSNAALFGKIYFPRLVMPISVVLFRMISLAVNFSLFVCFLLTFIVLGAKVQPNAWILATPLLVLQVMALAFGVGILASACTTRYRDVVQAFSYLLSLWMYATPIIYPISQVPDSWQWLFYVNPMSSVVEIFRHAYLGTASVNLTLWAVNAATTVVFLVIGVIAYNYTAKTVVDTV